MRVSATMSHWLTGQRVPPALPGDLGSEPPLAVCRPEQLVDVGDGGLQLDDKEGLGRFMPGEDVDHAPLPVDREGHLWGEHPLGELGREPPRDQLVQLGVPGVEQPIQVAGAPPGVDVDPDVKAAATRRTSSESHRSDVPTLHRLTSACDTLALLASSSCDQPRRRRTDRSAAPIRWSSMSRSIRRGCLAVMATYSARCD